MQNVEHIAEHRLRQRRSPAGPLRAVRPWSALDPGDRPPMVELTGVSKLFTTRRKERVAAIRELSLSIAGGAAVLVTGPSGSGKTTLLSLVGCMSRPTAGRIAVAGQEVSFLTEDRLAELRRRRFGFIFQHNLLIHGMSAVDNVMVPAIPRPEVNGSLPAKARDLLERFGVGRHAAERVERLSGGEQQRVAIARALINDPELLIADEPTAHLGRHDTAAFLAILEALRASGTTLLVASHDTEVVGCGLFSERVELRDGCLDPECA